MRLLPLFVLGLVACKMENPAFGVGTQTASDGSATGEDGEDGHHGDDGGDTGASDGGTGSTHDGTATSTKSEPEHCEYGRTPSLDIKLESSSNDVPCQPSRFGYFKIIEPIERGWLIEACSNQSGCTPCDPKEDARELTITPLPPEVAGAVTSGCMWLHFEELFDESSYCRYKGLTAWRQGEGTETPNVVASAQSYGTPLAAREPLGGFDPDVAVLWSCPCDEVEDVPDCCDEEPPRACGFVLPSEVLRPPGATTITLGDPDRKPFTFYAVQAYYSGVCDTDPHTSWALARP
jgi:hypothetical protein